MVFSAFWWLRISLEQLNTCWNNRRETVLECNFKDKSLRTVCYKTPFFQLKRPMTKKHHKSLNSQFTVVFNGIICFSPRFFHNSLLVLKMRFQVFSFAIKKVQGFSNDRKILMSLLSVLFHLQNRVSFFWNFNF